jgi:hypothetical protein
MGCHLLEPIANVYRASLPQKSCARRLAVASGDRGREGLFVGPATMARASTVVPPNGRIGRMGGANAAMIAGAIEIDDT